MLSETISGRSLAVIFRSTELSLDAVISVLDKLLQGRTKEKTGKQSLKDLKRKGNLQMTKLSENDAKNLNHYLRKYSVDFSILKRSQSTNEYLLFFRNYDAELLSTVMEDYSKDKFKQRESIADKIKRVTKEVENKEPKKKIKQMEKEESVEQ